MIAGYFDHNATTPIHPRVADEISRVSLEFPGNPASPYAAGRAARKRLEEARELVAGLLGAETAEVIFTSGGTEADNLAVMGAFRAAGRTDGHLVTTKIEHPAVLGAAEILEIEGAGVTRLDVDREGLLTVADFEAALRPETVLVSIMLANNETGAILPIPEMAGLARERGIVFHTDAVQAIGKIPVRLDDLGVDLLAVAAHKFRGPRGIGALLVRTGVPVRPMLVGGHQEGGLRPGTAMVALAAGLGAALEIAVSDLDGKSRLLWERTGRLLAGLRESIDGIVLNGPESDRLPNTLNLTIPGVGGEALLIALDREGYAIATGSACATGSALPSHVLTAMGLPKEAVSSSIRVSLGATTTDEDVDRLLASLPAAVERLRAVSRP